MKITKTQEDGKTIVALEGWLDIQATNEVEEFLVKLEPSKELELDFEKLEYISSSGVRLLILAYRKQMQNGGQFRIVNVTGEVYDVFSMIGLEKKLNISKI